MRRAKRVIEEAGLAKSCRVLCRSVYDGQLPALTRTDAEPFDACYFSGSLTLLPDPVGALHYMATMLKSDGRIYITQTFQRKSTPLMASIKPMLKYLTRIDFGQLYYEDDLENLLAEANMKVEHNDVIAGSVDTSFQAARLIVLVPGAPYVPRP